MLFDFLQNSFCHRCGVTGEKRKKSESKEAESRRRNSGSKKDEEKCKMLSDHTINGVMSENSSEPTTLTNITFSLPKVEGFYLFFKSGTGMTASVLKQDLNA